MAWPYEKPRKPDAAISRTRIAASRKRTFAWLTPSVGPYSYCEFCLTRVRVSYDPERHKHVCYECWRNAPRPKASRVTESEPADTPED